MARNAPVIFGNLCDRHIAPHQSEELGRGGQELDRADTEQVRGRN